MALDATALENSILDIYVRESAAKNSDVVKGVNATMVQKEDGTAEYNVEEIRGPQEVDPEQIRPLARAVAQAIIMHLQKNAEVDDPASPSNEKWVIK